MQDHEVQTAVSAVLAAPWCSLLHADTMRDKDIVFGVVDQSIDFCRATEHHCAGAKQLRGLVEKVFWWWWVMVGGLCNTTHGPLTHQASQCLLSGRTCWCKRALALKGDFSLWQSLTIKHSEPQLAALEPCITTQTQWRASCSGLGVACTSRRPPCALTPLDSDLPAASNSRRSAAMASSKSYNELGQITSAR